MKTFLGTFRSPLDSLRSFRLYQGSPQQGHCSRSTYGPVYPRHDLKHMVFPHNDPREVLSLLFSLVVRQELDLGTAHPKVLMYILVDLLSLVHTSHEIHEGESKAAVIWRGGFVLSRVEKLLELFRAKLIGKGGFFHHTNKVESGSNLWDTSGREVGVGRWCSQKVIVIKPRWRRRGWRRRGRGWGARRRRWR